MNTKKLSSVPPDCIFSEDVVIGANVKIGERVTLVGQNIVIKSNARLDAACVIGEGVTIGQGSWVRPGAVVLHSIPANAIVEGNPARIVGYLSCMNSGSTNSRLINTETFIHLDRPARIPLEVGESSLYLMRKIADSRGSLTVGDMPSELPFIPVRYFAVFDVPSIELRGEHAHKLCQQFLVCLHGSCRVLLDDGSKRCEVTLDRPDIGIYMPAMIWGTQYKFSSDAVLLVFASRLYEADDYLRTHDEFIAERLRITNNQI